MTPKIMLDRKGDRRAGKFAAAWIAKYGLTMRGFFVASVLFPPAGAVIAWKVPGLTWIARLAMTAFCGLVMVSVPTLIAMAGYYLVHVGFR